MNVTFYAPRRTSTQVNVNPSACKLSIMAFLTASIAGNGSLAIISEASKCIHIFLKLAWVSAPDLRFFLDLLDFPGGLGQSDRASAARASRADSCSARRRFFCSLFNACVLTGEDEDELTGLLDQQGLTCMCVVSSSSVDTKLS